MTGRFHLTTAHVKETSEVVTVVNLRLGSSLPLKCVHPH